MPRFNQLKSRIKHRRRNGGKFERDDSVSSGASILEMALRIPLAVSGLAYGAGFIVQSLHYSKFGTTNLQFLDLSHFIAGILFLIVTIIPGVVLFPLGITFTPHILHLRFRKSNESTYPTDPFEALVKSKISKSVTTPYRLLSSIVTVSIFTIVILFALRYSFAELPVNFTTFIPSPDGEFPPVTVSETQIDWTFLVPVFLYSFVVNAFLFLVFTAVGLFRRQHTEGQLTMFVAAAVSLPMCLVFVTSVSFFQTVVFPRIPAALGGGKPRLVHFFARLEPKIVRRIHEGTHSRNEIVDQFEQVAADDMNLERTIGATAWLILETSDGFYFNVGNPNQIRMIYLPRPKILMLETPRRVAPVVHPVH